MSTMARNAKIRRHILSREAIQSCDKIRLQREQQKQRLKDERHRNDGLLIPDGATDVTDPLAQKGRALSRHQIMERLTRINPALCYETSLRYPAQGGIYVVENRLDPVTGRIGCKRFICGIPNGTVNEFSLRLTLPSVIPDPDIALHWQAIQRVDQQTPGWRSILLRLMREGLITPSQTEQEFQITQGRSSQKWQQAVN